MIVTALAALFALALQVDTPPAPEPLELSLDEALHLALQNNLTIAGARLDAQATLENFGAAWGPFDTVLNAGGAWSKGTSAPSPSEFVGGIDVGSSPPVEVETWSWTTGLSGQFLTGTLWSFDIGPSKVSTQTSDIDTGAPVSSEVFTGDWSLAVVQPLLKGGGDYARSALTLARHDATIASLAAEFVASQTLETVTIDYWNLVFARQDRGTRELSVQLAQELLDITRRKFEQGLQNRIEVTQAEAELATRREELLTAQTTERNAEDIVRRQVFAPSDRWSWDRPIVPTTQPTPPQAETLDLDLAVDTALKSRADVAEERERLYRVQVELERARNQTDPQLDLTGGYGINADENSYSSVYTHLQDTNFDETSVALAFSLPLGNRSAGYTLRRTVVERERQGVALRDTEMNAVAEVRFSVREVELQLLRVDVTAEAVRLQTEVYDGERKRLENDLSTPFQVREFQRDLLTAIDNATRARLDLEVARTSLLAAQGKLLSVYGFERSMPELSLTDAPPAP
jgi:outer membrane protein